MLVLFVQFEATLLTCANDGDFDDDEELAGPEVIELVLLFESESSCSFSVETVVGGGAVVVVAVAVAVMLQAVVAGECWLPTSIAVELDVTGGGICC